MQTPRAPAAAAPPSPAHEPVPVDEAGNPLLRDIGAHLKKALKAAMPDADIK